MAREFADSANEASANCQNDSPIDRLPLAYVEFDCEARILEWNPAAERLLGYTKREAVGNCATALMLPESSTHRIRDILSRIWAGDFDAHSLNANRTKDGRIIDCYWFNTPIFDSDGSVIGGCGMGREIRSSQSSNNKLTQSSSEQVDDLTLFEGMTTRQRQILQLIATSHRTREIANELKISVKTVEMHRAHIMESLNIHDIPGLTRFAIRVRLVSA